MLDLDRPDVNRLLDCKADSTCVVMPNLDPVKLVGALAVNSVGALAIEPAQRGRLAAIRGVARTQFEDSGAHGLWLALGLLVWCDASGQSHQAPLALWPVQLDGVARIAADRSGAVEPCFNDVLGEKLRQDFDVRLPRDGAFDIAALLEAADAIVATRPGWRVERVACFGWFCVANAVLWRDLEARGDAVFASRVVAQLANAESAMSLPQHAEAELVAPLDADANQRRAIAAAGVGASFVLRGAPGTGKSQTIANLIVHCVEQGKSVLFVSNTPAGLAIVQRRLAGLGLGELCLEVYSGKANRAVVAAQLGRVLERAFRRFDGAASRPITAPNADARIAELRAALDRHATAMHRVGVFGRSLHTVLGRLVELRTAPEGALAEPDTVGLDGATFELRNRAVAQLGDTAVAVEPVAGHPWRASTLANWRSDGRERAVAALDEASSAAAALEIALGDVAKLVPGLVARTPEQLQTIGALAALAAASPRPGGELLTYAARDRGAQTDDLDEQIALIRARGTGTIEAPRNPHSFVALAKRRRELAAEVALVFGDAIAELDAAALWTQLRKWKNTTALVRFVALRNARAAVNAARHSGSQAGSSDAAMIMELEAVIAERACRDALAAAAEPAKRWFGELGDRRSGVEVEHGETRAAAAGITASPGIAQGGTLPASSEGGAAAPGIDAIDAALGWAGNLRRAFDAVDVLGGDTGRNAAWRSLVAQVAANPSSQSVAVDLARFAALADAVARWSPALAELAEATGIDREELGHGPGDHVAAVRERTEMLRRAIDGLRDWVMFHCARHHARSCGIGPVVAALDRGDLAATEVAVAWERATLLAWAEAEWTSLAGGATAGGSALAAFHGATHHADAAAFADLDRAATALVRGRALAKLAERRAAVFASPASADQLALLLEEVKQPVGTPLRALFASVPSVLPCVAPCLVMTPAAVAQHLDPSLQFDLVVIDEAAPMRTAEALGVLSRGAAGIVVADSRRAADGLASECIAARMPEIELVCHYASRHEDLIAFANHRFYDDRLLAIPAAHNASEHGVSWRHVAGVDDGLLEAQHVVAELLARLRAGARSIGVVVMGHAQQQLIEDRLDAARAADPDLDAWFDRDRLEEPVRVGHVDAWPGDARDVVLLSVGVDPSVFSHDGERRVAVASTRAREQLVVFSSLDLDGPDRLPDDVAPGIRELLAFARGSSANRRRDDFPASPITAAIARALAERGWTVRHSVGSGTYRIDLAVVDPSDSERYVLAIEHDGVAYASATAARDRDRLRPQVLAQLGWRLHRVWSLDWWSDPDRETQRAHSAIITAIAASRQRTAKPTKPRPPQREVPISEPSTSIPAVQMIDGATVPTFASGSSPVRLPRNAIAIGPYMAAAIPPGRRTPDDLFSARHLAELGKVIEQVLAAEAPMHLDLLARRVGGYFGIGRVTQRVTDQVRVVLQGRGRWGAEDNVVWRLDQNPESLPAVRVAGNSPTGRRDIHEIPLSELAAAARIVVERATGISTSDLIRDAARLIGFARITEPVTDRVAQGVRLAQLRELIRIDSGKATLLLD